MLNIRLKRIGRKKKPFYNIVVAEKLTYIKGKYIEKLGYFDPIKKIKKLNFERINYWLNKGADINQSIKTLLNKHN